MGKYNRGTSAHLSVLIYGQGHWREKDREIVRRSVLELKNTTFLMRRNQDSINSCPICRKIDTLFKKILEPYGSGLFYLQHIIHDTFDIQYSNDSQDVVNFVTKILPKKLVKKIYILQVKSFTEVSREQAKEIELEKYLRHIKINQSNFNELLRNELFEENVIYEIIKDFTNN